ncbi:MAG: hypothetical protein NT011_13580 [Kiritimatiellaeota bacterium]|nr:hypothetical protein [Kiritimatiellota bacterium]
MKKMTLNELANHISRRLLLVPLQKWPGSPDIAQLDIPDIELLLQESEVATRDTLDKQIVENSGGKMDFQRSPLDDWFLVQRWYCAADFCARLDDSSGKHPLLKLCIEDGDLRLYPWLLIDVWREWHGYWIINLARRLFRECHSPRDTANP